MKLILGMGLTGLSVARFFKSQQVGYQVADSRQSPPLLDTFIAEGLSDDCKLGFWKEDLLEGVEEVIVSPGIAMSEEIVIWAKEKNIPLVGDISYFHAMLMGQLLVLVVLTVNQPSPNLWVKWGLWQVKIQQFAAILAFL